MTFVVAAIVIVGLVVLRVAAGYPRPARPLRYLSRADAAVVDAAAEALFPKAGEPSLSARDAGVVDYVDRYMGWGSPLLRVLMRALFFSFEHATLLFVPSWRRLSSLSPEARERYLAGWESSRFYPRRLLFQSLRSLLCLAYMADENVQAALGITRPQSCTSRLVPGP